MRDKIELNRLNSLDINLKNKISYKSSTIFKLKEL